MKQTGEEFYIYVISTIGYCKIGMSANPKRRLKDAQTYNPHKLNLDLIVHAGSRGRAIILEEHFHDKYKKYHVRGEWFEARVLKKMIRYLKLGRYKGEAIDDFLFMSHA